MSGNTFVSSSRYGKLKFLGIVTSKCMKEIIGNSGPVFGIANINDGIFISCARNQIENSTSRIWDLVSCVFFAKLRWMY